MVRPCQLSIWQTSLRWKSRNRFSWAWGHACTREPEAQKKKEGRRGGGGGHTYGAPPDVRIRVHLLECHIHRSRCGGAAAGATTARTQHNHGKGRGEEERRRRAKWPPTGGGQARAAYGGNEVLGAGLQAEDGELNLDQLVAGHGGGLGDPVAARPRAAAALGDKLLGIGLLIVVLLCAHVCACATWAERGRLSGRGRENVGGAANLRSMARMHAVHAPPGRR